MVQRNDIWSTRFAIVLRLVAKRNIGVAEPIMVTLSRVGKAGSVQDDEWRANKNWGAMGELRATRTKASWTGRFGELGTINALLSGYCLSSRQPVAAGPVLDKSMPFIPFLAI